MVRRILLLLIISTACTALVVPGFARSDALVKAKSAAESGDWEAVFEHAQQAVKDEPKNEDGWALLARAELFLGDTVSAIEHYETAVEGNPRHPSAVLELTSLYVSSGDTESADRVVTAAEERDRRGKYDEIKVARALILGAQGKLGEASPILASASGKHPDNPVYPKMLARIYRDAGVLELAATYYGNSWALDEGDPELAFEYGQVLLKLKRYDEANRLFKIVQERDPDNKFVDYLRGRLYHAAGRFAEATAELDKAVQKRPNDFLSNYWLGRSYIDLSKSGGPNVFHLAVPALRKALELRPEREDVLDDLAEAIYQRGRFAQRAAGADTTEAYKHEKYREAIDFYHESLSLVPNQEETFAQLARCHDKLGNLDSAIHYTGLQLDTDLLLMIRTPEFALEDFETPEFELPDLTQIPGPDFDPIPPEVHALLDSLPLMLEAATRVKSTQSNITRMISLLQRTKQQAELAEFLAPLMDIEEIFDKYGLILVNAYMESKQFARASNLADRLLDAKPDDCDIWRLRAYIDLKQEHYCAAANVLVKGVRACPNSADLWVLLGDSHYFCNEKDRATVERARDAYQRACDKGNSDGCEKQEQIEQILARLR